MTPAPVVVEIRAQVGLAVAITQQAGRVLATVPGWEREIEVAALNALVEIHELASNARREFGLDGSGQVITIMFSFSVVEPQPVAAPLEVELEAINPGLLALACAEPANRLPI